jgi:Domain of unknown function (DUF397)
MDLHWRTSSYSTGNGLCVELAVIDDGIAVRDSKDRAGGTLRFSGASFRAFLGALSRAEFDRPAR